jgi:ribosomal protein S12 methylthiotransferase
MVNTCAFIESAREEAINTILDLAQYKKENSKLIVLGCLSQRYKDELIKELPEVDLFVKISDYNNIAKILNDLLKTNFKDYDTLSFLNRPHKNPNYMTYVRISDGCQNRCGFCAIPLIRGTLKSRTIESIHDEVVEAVENGAYEINLISQDTTKYGYDLYKKLAITDLLEDLCNIEGNFKIRLLYLYPDIVTDELINFIKTHDKVMPYFDIPLQHSEDHILKSMYRRGMRDYLVNLIKKIKEEIPHAIFRTTMIVGYPGETEDDVDNLIKFMEETRFDRLGVFTYSAEEGTYGATLKDQVPEEIKNERYNRVMDAQFYISLDLNRQKIGQVFDVLVEGYDPESYFYRGRSYGFAPDDIDGAIYFAAHSELNPGDVIKVKILDADSYSLTGETYEED